MSMTRQRVMVGLALAVSWTSALFSSDESRVDLRVGDPAPTFEAVADNGQRWKSSDYVGRKILVIYFYPADMTGGCTRQACGFRDDLDALAQKEVAVVGVSGDSVRNHWLFKRAHDLNFPLLADEDGTVAKLFGVPLRAGGSITRTIDGKEEVLTRGVTAERWTFVIDYDGNIALKNTKVDAASDARSIARSVDELRRADVSFFRHGSGIPENDDRALPASFGPETQVWRHALLSGHSTPCIVGGQVVVTTHDGVELATVSLHRDTGGLRWKRVAPNSDLEPFHAAGSPAASSPASDGERIYVFFGSYGLLCYSLDGQLLWSKRLGPFQNEFGASSSPIVVDDKVILAEDHDLGSFVIAVDKRTGKTAWKTSRDEFTRSFSTPVVWEVDGGKQLVVAGALQLTGYDLRDGKRLWWVNGLARLVSSTPAVTGGVVYVSSWSMGGDTGGRISILSFAEALKQYDVDGDGNITRAELPQGGDIQRRFFRVDLNQDGNLVEAEWSRQARVFELAQNALVAVRPSISSRGDLSESDVLWKHRRNVPSIPSPLVYRDVVYMVKDSAIVSSIDARTGQALKRGRAKGLGKYFASPVAGDGKVYLASERGVVTILKAGREWEVIGSHDFGERIMSTPVIHNGRIYVRTGKALYCFAESG